jgi:pyruvate dehydrogenase (quinone)
LKEQAKGKCLVHSIMVAMPPKLEFDQMTGFALYMGKMMLCGRMDEAFKIISSNYKHLGDVI